MFLDGDGIVCATLDTIAVSIGSVDAVYQDLRAIISNDHAHCAFDCANACHDTSSGYVFSRIHLMAGKS